MAIKENSEAETTLEGLVDKHSLTEVVEALARIAYAKGEHLRTNWQDVQIG